MTYNFDDLARALASGISRREALKRMGMGFAGLLLSSVGLKKASAQVTCGTCQACNLDTITCGLTCPSPSSGQVLCTAAAQDGSYIRLSDYLTSEGFALDGPSNSVVFNQSGSLLSSVLLSNFTSSSVSGETAFISYAVSAHGDIAVSAMVLQGGTRTYGLNVDPSGRVIQTVATNPTNPANAKGAAASASAARALPAKAGVSSVLAGTKPSQVTPDISAEACGRSVDIICGVLAYSTICYYTVTALCFESGPIFFLPCELALGILCAAYGYADCELFKAGLCDSDCEFNQQSCNGVCCDPCMDCLNGSCVANTGCGSQACCNNVCCPDGYTCVDGVCTSPSSGCAGADCATYSSCNGDSDCFCGTLAEGGGLCQVSVYCDGLVGCPDGSCPDGSFCLIGSCCGDPVCVPDSAICPSSSSSAARKARPALRGGRTTGPPR